MGAPIEISGLPPAASAADADFTIIRQGLTDFRATVGMIRNINISALPSFPTSSPAPLNSDYMILSRGGSSFKALFSSVGFAVNTCLWFYNSTSQLNLLTPGWQIVPNTGDRLLACKGGSTYNVAQTNGGTWTQPSFKLSIGQIPAHQHGIRVVRNPASTNNYSTDKVSSGIGGQSTSQIMKSFHTGGVGSTTGSSNPDAYEDFTDSFSTDTDPIQPVATWRPLANVGNIYKKIA